MIEGKLEHERLESEFRGKAVPASLTDMLEQSKVIKVVSREFPVVSFQYGIHGKIDEIQLTPHEFVIIDDKPRKKVYLSDIHQVYGYCLAFKGIVGHKDSRQIVAELRERGTNNIYWKASFTETAENEIKTVINHIHDLILGENQFISNKNPNKCKACRFNHNCDRVASSGAKSNE